MPVKTAKKAAKKTASRTRATRTKQAESIQSVPFKLDIACGQRKGPVVVVDNQLVLEDGWTGIDIAPIDGVDIVHDLNVYPWPIEDNSVDEAHCSHYVEHIPHDIPGSNLDGLIAFMNELYRILKPGASVKIITPYYSSMRAFQDPTHRRYMCDASWLYFDQGWMKANGLDHYGITADFEFATSYSINQAWQGRSHEVVSDAVSKYFNVVDDMIVNLKKR